MAVAHSFCYKLLIIHNEIPFTYLALYLCMLTFYSHLRWKDSQAALHDQDHWQLLRNVGVQKTIWVDQSGPNAEQQVTVLSKIYLMGIHSHQSNWTSHSMHMCRPTKLL